MKRAVLALFGICATQVVEAAPVVTSDSQCPSATEVSAQLATLWRSDRPMSGAARIHLDGTQLLIDLAGENEAVVTRSLPIESDCRSRAQAAALVIAAWLDTVTADPVGLPPPAAPERKPATAPTHPPPPQLLLGLGGFATLDARGAGGLLDAEAEWLRVVGRLGLRAGLSFPLPRSMAVGQGTSLWWRPVLNVAMVLPFRHGPWTTVAGAGPALGLLVVSGKGFDRNHSQVTPSWGGLATLRLAYTRSGGATVWSELRGLLWPAAQSIRNNVVGSTARESALPRFEGHLGVGFSFAVF